MFPRMDARHDAARFTWRKRPLALCVTLLAAGLVSAVAGVMPARAATAPQPRIDLKVLLLGTSTTAPDFQNWEAALGREGVHYDTIVGKTHTPITAATLSGTLADGTPEAKYQAVIVSTGGLTDCSTSPCVSDLTTDEWTALESYEHRFNIRQISADVYPGTSFGMNTPTVTGTLDGISGSLTTAGQKVFPYLKATAPITMDTGTYGYEATPVSATNFDTLVTGPNSSALVGIYYHPDGVQEMVETFNGNQYQLQSALLRHGALVWATRGVMFGHQRNYLEANIDDNFLADDSWNTATHQTDYAAGSAIRMSPADVDQAAVWSAKNNFRIDQLFNGGGSVQFANGCTLVSGGDTGSGGLNKDCNPSKPNTDPLLAEYQKTNPATGKPYTQSFGWVNHTWDHPNLDQGCATQNYIEAEIQQNTNWAAKPSTGDGNPATGGLGLSSTTDPAVVLGAQNPGVVVTGEHSGLANLIPGNPGTVDPPSFNQVTSAAGTLPAGTYNYAITSQFSAAGGESSASTTQLVLTTASNVTLQWTAVCHAAQYKLYRQSGTGAWTLVATIPASASSFGDPASTTDTTGGGAQEVSFTDTGAAGTAQAATWVPPTVNNAVESAYQQNTTLQSAFSAIGIKVFGSDSSKPYPNPASATFANGAPPSTQYAAGATFPNGTAQAEPRYPTNIYYNVSTEAQAVDEYNHLYMQPPSGVCVNSATTTCRSTPATFADIVASVDQGMFGHMMGNDPRPHYFHQSNLMGTPPAGAPTTGTPPATSPSTGDGLFYTVMDGLLAQYGKYFNTPIEQPTSQGITDLLTQQDAWNANTTVSGYIQGNQVTLTNSGSAVTVPLTGVTTVGSDYGGVRSGWTSVPAGTSTYTAVAAWPVDTMTVALSPASVAADGQATATATATLSADGRALTTGNDTVLFTTDDAAVKVSAVTDNKNGTYTATLTSSTTVHPVTVSATASSVAPAASGTGTFTQTAGPATHATVTLAPASIAADGTSTSTATVTIADAANHPVPGEKVAVTTDDPAVKVSAVTDGQDGTYKATLTSSKVAHTVTVTATDSSVTPALTANAALTQTAAPAPPANPNPPAPPVTPAPPSTPQPPKATLPSNQRSPVISGTAVVGKTVSATSGTWSGTAPISLRYQWLRCRTTCAAIAGATGRSYRLGNGDAGARLKIRVTASNAAGSAQATSASFGPVLSQKALAARAARVRNLLRSTLAPPRGQARLAILLRNGGYRAQFNSPDPGRLTIAWTLGGSGRHATASVLIARATVTPLRSGRITVKVALTPAGRRSLARIGVVRLLAQARFETSWLPAVDARGNVTLRR